MKIRKDKDCSLRMPWGKFSGIPIWKLPSSYLKWLAENVNENNETHTRIVLEADKEWSHREKYGTHINEVVGG